MKYSLSHLSDQTLLHGLAALVARDRATTADLLTHITEVDERRLYLPAGYPSMFVYCVQELALCEQAAYYRIRAARTARQFPTIFSAVAEGRLNVSTVVLLAPHLTAENSTELLAAAAGRSKTDVERFLAERFPKPDLPAQVRALSIKVTELHALPGPLDFVSPGPDPQQLSPGIVDPPTVVQSPGPSAPEPIDARPKVTPLAPRRFALQLTMSHEMHDDLRRARELLGHQVPSGDVAEVIHRALKLLVSQLERAKFAATDKPRPPRVTQSARYIAAHVKRAVRERDGDQCSFVSERGQRCQERTRLEFDHVDPVARGGRASISGIRLRCRSHNQYEAERIFGVEFMRLKRAAARGVAAAASARGVAAAASARAVEGP